MCCCIVVSSCFSVYVCGLCLMGLYLYVRYKFLLLLLLMSTWSVTISLIYNRVKTGPPQLSVLNHTIVILITDLITEGRLDIFNKTHTHTHRHINCKSLLILLIWNDRLPKLFKRSPTYDGSTSEFSSLRWCEGDKHSVEFEFWILIIIHNIFNTFFRDES